MKKEKLTKILKLINEDIDLIEMSVFAAFYIFNSQKCNNLESAKEILAFYRAYKNMFPETKMMIMSAAIDEMCVTISHQKKIKIISKYIYMKAKNKIAEISYKKIFKAVKDYFTSISNFIT